MNYWKKCKYCDKYIIWGFFCGKCYRTNVLPKLAYDILGGKDDE